MSETADVIAGQSNRWDAIDPENVARMKLQNRFLTGLDIARYTAGIMRRDMAAYDADPSRYTRSLGCWHGFIGQQKLISVKKHFGGTDGCYLYLSGWMIAALRSEFGPLPDQSIHEKTAVPELIEELYTFLKQADARELRHLFTELDAARDEGNQIREKAAMDAIEGFQTHVVPIIADIDAGFGNAEATYLLAKKMIEAGACALQIENQVSDEKQCGHQDGKVTVPHEDFLAKVQRGSLRLHGDGRGRRHHRHPHRLAGCGAYARRSRSRSEARRSGRPATIPTWIAKRSPRSTTSSLGGSSS